MKNYGYKICYKLKGKKRFKVYLVTDSHAHAVWSVRWYESNSPTNRKTGEKIENAIWIILPIKTLAEYKWRWRGCPF